MENVVNSKVDIFLSFTLLFSIIRIQMTNYTDEKQITSDI